MTNFKKIVIYIILIDIKSNGASDLLEKASMQLVVHSLAPQARKIQSIDKLFLATKKWFKRCYERDSKDALKDAIIVCHHLKGIHSLSDTNRTGIEGLSFYYFRLLNCLNQMLAVVLLSQH